MSQQHYIKKWNRAQLDLNRIVRIERPLKKPQPEKERKAAFGMVSLRYIKYICIYQRLVQCYDYMVHPQKRILIGRCLEGVTGRIVELRWELIRIDIREYSFLNAVLSDLKLKPKDIEMSLSKFTALQKVSIIRKRVNLLDYILTSTASDAEDTTDGPVYTIIEAVLLIQKNERAFQARRRSIARKKTRRRGPKRPSGEVVSLADVNVKAVTRFQAMWRGHRDRKMLGARKQEAAIFLDMREPKHVSKVDVMEATVISNKFKEATENQDTYVTDTILATEHMMEHEGPSMADNMKRQIIQWILECRNVTGEFPQFPDEDQGGSMAIFSEKTVTEVEEDMDLLQEQLLKGTKPPKEKKEAKKKKKEKKKKDPSEFEMKPSKFVDEELVPVANEYGTFWWGKEERYNRKQTYDRNLMLEDITKNVEATIRLQVDEIMRNELERLATGIDKKPPPKPKKKKEKKKKKDKKKKGKKMKDLTPGVPIEDLYRDLVLDGIIKKVPDVSLSSFIGDFNYMCESDASTIETKQDLGDVRKMAFDFGILPMSSANVHNIAPFYKSLIIVGPHGSGKKMLVNAIAYELGANLFDLSPENLEDKYEGKEGQQMLIHLVMKVGKEMEPSVIFVGNCDLMFTKKLSPDVAFLKPGRWKKDLQKALKFITGEDRILLIGTTKFPFKAKMGPMMKMYQRLIFIYPPSHGSRFMLWRKLITEHKGIIYDDFDLTALAHVTRGFTAGDIHNAVIEVLTENRIKKQGKHPLRTSEFVARIATFDPVFIPEMEEFEKWLAKTPLSKKRNNLMKKEAEGQDIVGLL